MTINMVYVEISDFFDERQPRYDHSKNDLKYTPSGAILEWFWGGAPAAPREGLGSNSIWLWTYPMGTWSPMIPKQSYQIWPFPATVWGTHGSRLNKSKDNCMIWTICFHKRPFSYHWWLTIQLFFLLTHCGIINFFVHKIQKLIKHESGF